MAEIIHADDTEDDEGNRENKGLMAEIILFPTNENYCKECAYHNNNGTCSNEKYNQNSYKVNCVWKYCKYKRKRGNSTKKSRALYDGSL